jgi:hypothetical protein
MKTNEIINLLSIYGNSKLIGSNANNKLKYVTDYDLQEHVIIKNVSEYEKILNRFQVIFKTANESDNLYITDMKAGIFNTLPIRWNKEDIMNGFKQIDTKHVEFVNTLYSKNNTVKLDLIAYVNNEYVEFSCNYYFSQYNIKDSVIFLSLMVDIRKYYLEKKLMKMLKRIMSYRTMKNENINNLVSFFNSKAGLLYQLQHKIDVILLLLEKYSSINKTNILNAATVIFKELPNNINVPIINKTNIITKLQTVQLKLSNEINNLVIDFINS